jgi:integrase
MLVKLSSHGYVLTDDLGLPRFWAAAWILMVGGSLASSTLKQRLANIEAFYVNTDSNRQTGALDDAMGAVDLAALEEMLEAFFVTLTTVPDVGVTAEQRWRDSLAFVRDICERLTRTPNLSTRFEDLRLRLEHLNRLYGQLRTAKKSRSLMVRALPAAVMQALYDAVIPGAATNPFQNEASQWRAYAAFLLLLHQGLRRGEALLLPADFLKSESTPSGIQYWLNVRTNEYEDDDPRYSTPSIKTLSSIRQIPVSPATACALMTYLDNYRGKQNHSFFLSSAKDRPLSAEGLHYFFLRLTAALPPACRKLLCERTGMTSISAHDLRHTAAVVRLKQLLSRGDPMPEALQKLRSFFGWSANSPMPQLYAKAAFEERLQTVWSDEFDDRVAMLMALPQ